jgi:SET domain-containing protein
MSSHPMSYRSPKTIVKESSIHGRGLFAREDIAAGQEVAAKGGIIFDRAQLQEIEKELGPAEIQIGEDLFIGPVKPEDREGAMLFLNHSCEPNVGIRGQIVFVAIRDIAAGEELTSDWAMSDDDDYSLECNCNSSNCRRHITGKDWQLPALQAKYAGFFADYLVIKIRSSGP